jgi:hypothetical protein
MIGFDLSSNFTKDLESLVRKARIRFDSSLHTRSEFNLASFVPSTSITMDQKMLREYSAPSTSQKALSWILELEALRSKQVSL